MIVLDTHVLLWLRSGSERLGGAARSEIERAWQAGEVCVSAISFWEVALLKVKGRLEFPEEVALWRREQLEQGVIELAVDGEIGIRAASLPDVVADPADRLIVATALGGHVLVTADRRLVDWPGPLRRLDAAR
ncbi:MAG: type II toxin-antitoxin system VapC family toxin [bacterium]|nr:type II toxin-antitoxin system VapC family toxin [bacterium]